MPRTHLPARTATPTCCPTPVTSSPRRRFPAGSPSIAAIRFEPVYDLPPRPRVDGQRRSSASILTGRIQSSRSCMCIICRRVQPVMAPRRRWRTNMPTSPTSAHSGTCLAPILAPAATSLTAVRLRWRSVADATKAYRPLRTSRKFGCRRRAISTAMAPKRVLRVRLRACTASFMPQFSRHAAFIQAVFNYTFVLRDPGTAYHNGRYILQLLYDSLESLAARRRA
jgi:hypothetical protein